MLQSVCNEVQNEMAHEKQLAGCLAPWLGPIIGQSIANTTEMEMITWVAWPFGGGISIIGRLQAGCG